MSTIAVRAVGSSGDSCLEFCRVIILSCNSAFRWPSEWLAACVHGDITQKHLTPVLPWWSLPGHLSSIQAGRSTVGVQGSLYGDSQVIRLQPEAVDPAQPSNFVEVMDVWTNLGPIIDLAVVDLERQGQGQVVTCSGKGPDSSLRIVRNGIGMIEQAAVELAGPSCLHHAAQHRLCPHICIASIALLCNHFQVCQGYLMSKCRLQAISYRKRVNTVVWQSFATQ